VGITTGIVYKKGLKTVTTGIVYKKGLKTITCCMPHYHSTTKIVYKKKFKTITTRIVYNKKLKMATLPHKQSTQPIPARQEMITNITIGCIAAGKVQRIPDSCRRIFH